MPHLSATRKGIVTAITMIVFACLFYFGLKYPANGFNQFVLYGIFAAGILWSIVTYSRTHTEAGPKILFQQGFKTFIVATLFMVAFTFIYYKTHPQILEDAIVQNNALIKAQQNHTPDEILQNEKNLRSIFIPMMVSITTIKYLVMGVIFSVIFSVLFRKP